MNTTRKLLSCAVILAFLFIGCATEITAPDAPVIAKGTLHIVNDAFLTSGNYYVYTPPEYDANRAEGYPVIYMLHGFGGDENYFVALFSAVDAADLLLANSEIEPMILVFPSASNAFGGSFYTDSPHPAVGNSQQHILDIIADVDGSYNTLADPAKRAICGHSMGGYGALSIAMNTPNTFGSVACIAAPITFWGTMPDADTYKGIQELMPSILAETGYDEVLANNPVGDYARYQELMVPSSDKRLTSMMFAMGAAFSPTDPANPGMTSTALGVDLPIGLDGQIDMTVWNRWLTHDPLRRLSTQYLNLVNVNLFLDAGAEDDLGLFGAHDVFAGAIQTLGLPINLTHYETYASFLDSEGYPIKADHTVHTYERLKVLLMWQSNQF